jgi:alpha-mannosidase
VYPLIPQTTVEPPTEMTIQRDYLENRFYQIKLNEYGQITSIWDKSESREVLVPNRCGNIFQAFEDKPSKFDAWDIELFYQEKMQEISELVAIEVEEQGPLRGTLRLQWRFYDSMITQQISIYRNSRRIDFRTEIDWHEQQVLLKVAFPVNIRSTKATYEIQFGAIERPTHWNTSWDYARFEVCAHKWADLSEGNYGVALLNDCKYGYDIKDNLMRLTLLRSPIRPDAQADKGKHIFTYSLLPHRGDVSNREIHCEAYQLNYPWRAELLPAQPNEQLPSEYSFAEGAYVIIETVKKAEIGEAWIVRAYEPSGFRKNDAYIDFSSLVKKAVECNLIEEGETPVDLKENRLTFAITPYEIKTFKVWF